MMALHHAPTLTELHLVLEAARAVASRTAGRLVTSHAVACQLSTMPVVTLGSALGELHELHLVRYDPRLRGYLVAEEADL